MNPQNAQFSPRTDPYSTRPQVAAKRTSGNCWASSKNGAYPTGPRSTITSVSTSIGKSPSRFAKREEERIGISDDLTGVGYGYRASLSTCSARRSWPSECLGRKIRSPRRPHRVRSRSSEGSCSGPGERQQSYGPGRRALCYSDTLPRRQSRPTQVNTKYVQAAPPKWKNRFSAQPPFNGGPRYLALEAARTHAVRPCCQSTAHGSGCRGG